MKKSCCFKLLLFIGIFLSAFIVIPKGSSASCYSISTNKRSYSYKEDIKISYSGAVNKLDWVGIYKVNGKLSSNPYDASLAFRYVSGDRNTFTFSPTTFISGNESKYSPEKGQPLEPGEYKAIIATNDSYQVAAQCEFTVRGDKPKASFDVISDIHITEYTDVNNNNLIKVFEDIHNVSKNSSSIIFNGDSVDSCKWDAYANLREICYKDNYGSYNPFIFMNVGNHEFFDNPHTNDFKSTSYDDKLSRFFYFADSVNRSAGRVNNDYMWHYDEKNKERKAYYSVNMDGYTFVFLGNERLADKDRAYISSDQTQWLNEKCLYPICKYQEHQPIFVFGHQGLYDTVAGTHSGQGWDGIYDRNQDNTLKYYLNKYASTFYFSGHSHWDLNSNGASPRNIRYDGSAVYGNGPGTVMFTDGGVGNAWNGSGDSYTGSTGLHVDIYEDKVIVKGRDYLRKAWIPGARYEIDLDSRYDYQDQVIG